MYNSDYCNQDIFNNGVSIMNISGDATGQEMEDWCAQLRTRSGQPVDWMVCCGRDVIKTTGDVAKVKEAVIESYPQLYHTVLTRNREIDEDSRRFLLSYNMRV